MNIGQVIATALTLGLIAAGGYLMHMFFGLVGVGLFVGMMVPTMGFVVWVINRGQSSSGNATQTSRAHMSKGARGRRED